MERIAGQKRIHSTRVSAVKAGWLNVTLRNHRNTDALDGVLGAARNTLLCPRCVPVLNMLSRHVLAPCLCFPSALARYSRAMVERSLFRAKINSDCKYLEVPPGAVSH